MIRQQRKQSQSSTTELRVAGRICRTDDEIREGWQEHFRTLASPKEHPSFDDAFKVQVPGAHQYGLPLPYEVVLRTPTKERWKQAVKCGVRAYWTRRIESEADSKSSLTHMNKQMTVNSVADIWETSTENVIESSKAQLKARVLTGTYRLQALAKRQNQHETDGTCRLCKQGEEDRTHFVTACSALEGIRQIWETKISDFLERHGWEQLDWRQNRDLFLHACLDCRGFLSQSASPPPYAVHELERLSRGMLNQMHRCRWVCLEKLNINT
jgi:hypothetical protein